MIYILGAGGFGKEVLNIYIDLFRENEVAGFLEENCESIGRIINGKPTHDISILNNLDRNSTKLICAIGTPLRKRLIENTRSSGFGFDTVLHPSIIKSEWVTFGEGSIIYAGSIFTNQIAFGEYSIVHMGCTIGHDVNIGKYTTIMPGCHVSGNVSIGDECLIGTGAVIIEKISIGTRSCIGAGSVVVKDIPDDVLAVGVPAKPIKSLTKSAWKKLI